MRYDSVITFRCGVMKVSQTRGSLYCCIYVRSTGIVEHDVTCMILNARHFHVATFTYSNPLTLSPMCTTHDQTEGFAFSGLMGRMNRQSRASSFRV